MLPELCLRTMMRPSTAEAHQLMKVLHFTAGYCILFENEERTCRVDQSAKKFFNGVKNGSVAAAAAVLDLPCGCACSGSSLHKPVKFSANACIVDQLIKNRTCDCNLIDFLTV